MTRGRGMGENQRAQWIMSMPACAKLKVTLQDLTGTGFQTSDIHKGASTARMSRDKKDISAVLEFLRLRNPFEGDNTLRNIHTGEIAHKSVNADTARIVGKKIISTLPGQNIVDYTFKKSQQVVTLSSKCKAKLDGDPVDVDPQLLFQRCTTAANGMF
ncbi:uncharacterized protein LOC134239534 [Saccostrea cucullata]|uniref:uncharacterized protein LOC134239534 n=1 Tax=Saccostrea cuccullata TaxID=36930 RepID=UPI002ED69435